MEKKFHYFDDLKLPYRCEDSAKLPNGAPPPPRLEDIRKSLANVSPNPNVPKHHPVGEHYMVKYGKEPFVSRYEGTALHHFTIRDFSPPIPAPKLYAMYSDGDILYIVMGRIKGEPLSKLWPKLDEGAKDTMLKGLKGTLSPLGREVYLHPYAPFKFCNVTGGRLPARSLLASPEAQEGRSSAGPFQAEGDFHAALVRRCKGRGGMSGWVERHYHEIAKSESPIRSSFTHGNLSRENILVSRLEDGRCRFTLLNWENAGFYPAYWEYARAFADCDQDDDWPRRLADIIESYPAEGAMLKLLKECLDS